jgi:folate-binding protein YgfZ
MTAPLVAWVSRDVVVVQGPDATSFLQSLVSQDLDLLAVGDTTHTLLLQPQGKLLVDFYAVHRQPDTWWCVCEGGFGAALADGLSRFKIRVKAEIEIVTSAAIAVRGVGAVEADGLCVVPVEWGDMPAVDVLGTREELVAFAERLRLPWADEAMYERARIEAGVPRQGVDIDERTIPQEAGLERTAVSFTKGCFVGQELVCRIDSRGHVNRLLRRIRASEDGALVVGDDVSAGDKTVGSIASSAGDVALALVRREVEPGATVQVGSASATVEALWTDDD